MGREGKERGEKEQRENSELSGKQKRLKKEVLENDFAHPKTPSSFSSTFCLLTTPFAAVKTLLSMV